MLHIKTCDKILEILHGHTFQFYLQPIVDLSANSAIGYEVLRRINQINTESFFKVTAKCGLTHQVDSIILRQVLPMVARLPQRFFINIFPSTVVNFPFFDYDCSRVVFEITEQEEVVDIGALAQSISKFNLAISLDDLGVGYANLAKLIDLKPNFVKLDRQLIDHIDESIDKRDLVKALYSYSQARFQVIAEGIERTEELQVLRELGIALGQGYLLGKPELWR